MDLEISAGMLYMLFILFHFVCFHFPFCCCYGWYFCCCPQCVWVCVRLHFLLFDMYESEIGNIPMLRPSVKSIEWILRNGNQMQTNVRQVCFLLFVVVLILLLVCLCITVYIPLVDGVVAVFISYTCSLRPIGYPFRFHKKYTPQFPNNSQRSKLFTNVEISIWA